MTLSSDKLKTEIRKFQDPKFAQFGAFPQSTSDAAEKWASAFDTFIQDLIVITPTTATPVTSSATLSGVKSAFKAPLTFAVGLGSDVTEATELASAWAAGINAIVLVPGATYDPAGDTISAIVPFSTVSTQQTALQKALQALFDAPSLDAEQRADDLATAFYKVTTSAVQTKCTTQSPSGVATAGQPFAYG